MQIKIINGENHAERKTVTGEGETWEDAALDALTGVEPGWLAVKDWPENDGRE